MDMPRTKRKKKKWGKGRYFQNQKTEEKHKGGKGNKGKQERKAEREREKESEAEIRRKANGLELRPSRVTNGQPCHAGYDLVIPETLDRRDGGQARHLGACHLMVVLVRHRPLRLFLDPGNRPRAAAAVVGF